MVDVADSSAISSMMQCISLSQHDECLKHVNTINISTISGWIKYINSIIGNDDQYREITIIKYLIKRQYISSIDADDMMLLTKRWPYDDIIELYDVYDTDRNWLFTYAIYLLLMQYQCNRVDILRAFKSRNLKYNADLLLHQLLDMNVYDVPLTTELISHVSNKAQFANHKFVSMVMDNLY